MLMHRRWLALLLPLFATTCISASVSRGGSPAPREGLVTLPSSHSVEETFERLRAAIQAQDALTIIATVDHSANARRAGLELPPTRLIIFGNPNLGTPLMRGSRTVGIDLPQKFLIWEDGDGRVFINYNDPEYLRRRHNLRGEDPVLQQIADALRGLAESAARR